MNKRDKIEEAYVSFEVGRLLKEKGFNECETRYAETLGNSNNKYITSFLCEDWEEYVPAPTQQMAMQWLRKKHKLHIEIRTTKCHDFFYVIYGLGKKYLCISCEYDKGEYWAEPEEAIEDALKYILTKVI